MARNSKESTDKTQPQENTAAAVQGGAEQNARIVAKRRLERAEQLHEQALKREKKRSRRIAIDEHKLEAREADLISNATLAKRRALKYDYGFSDPGIRLHVIRNWMYLDEFFYRLVTEIEGIIRSYKEARKQGEELRRLVGEQLNELETYALTKLESVTEQFTKHGLKVKDKAEHIISKPIVFGFELTSPMTNRWLKAMSKLDAAAELEFVLSFEGVLPSEIVVQDTDAMINRANQFTHYITNNARAFYRLSNRLRDERQAQQAQQILREKEIAEQGQGSGAKSADAPQSAAPAKSRRRRNSGANSQPQQPNEQNSQKGSENTKPDAAK